eukprot:EW703805.1.p3 GENE.EW703805.1~~EW703805.1.p3  ORF type:complete len:97 (+),score=53.90 EW703805.1:65-355(+)
MVKDDKKKAGDKKDDKKGGKDDKKGAKDDKKGGKDDKKADKKGDKKKDEAPKEKKEPGLPRVAQEARLCSRWCHAPPHQGHRPEVVHDQVRRHRPR